MSWQPPSPSNSYFFFLSIILFWCSLPSMPIHTFPYPKPILSQWSLSSKQERKVTLLTDRLYVLETRPSDLPYHVDSHSKMMIEKYNAQNRGMRENHCLWCSRHQPFRHVALLVKDTSLLPLKACIEHPNLKSALSKTKEYLEIIKT